MALLRTPQQVIAAIKQLAVNKTNIGVGACQKNAHEIYGIPSDGTLTAALAWNKAKFKHPMNVEPPQGAFVYWTGGHTIVDGAPAGHVAIYAGRGRIFRHHRYVWSPGAPPDALGGNDTTLESRWVKVRLGSIANSKAWPGHTLAGWSEDNDGQRIPGLAPKAA